jgi:hypothetical protein
MIDDTLRCPGLTLRCYDDAVPAGFKLAGNPKTTAAAATAKH